MWEDLDAYGSGFIDASTLTAVLLAVPSPMGVEGLDRVPRRIQDIVQQAIIPLRGAQQVRRLNI